MKQNQLKFAALLLAGSLASACAQTNSLQLPPIATGPFTPDWNSLRNYQTPEWFRDAKFGIWAHWGPQCQPEHGDWYARSMYEQGSGDYKSHLAEYGHPSTNGFKDVIHQWKAENFNPDKVFHNLWGFARLIGSASVNLLPLKYLIPHFTSLL